jgi:hypothetical protein
VKSFPNESVLKSGSRTGYFATAPSPGATPA